MLNKIFSTALTCTLLLIAGFHTNCTDKSKIPESPNIVFILTDDLGYGDLGCFGNRDINTPNIDRMAAEGTRLTCHYAAPCCTPARASFMTGCYPRRVDLDYGSYFVVLLAGDSKGLNPEEQTIAEVLKSGGYKTGIIGKWHLGDQPGFLPDRHGFDYFFGLPYSNDISSKNNVSRWTFPPLPLMRNREILDIEPDQDRLTQDYTKEAVQFIERNKENPFFLYIAHSMPHVPIHVSESYLKDFSQSQIDSLDNEFISTRNCLYPAAIKELDWSVGEILQTLKKHSLDEKTLIVFTSDNGPISIGSAGPFRGHKGSAYEGGIRVPCVARWNGVIPPGKEYNGITSLMDWLPTFAEITNTRLPEDFIVDGKNIFPQVCGKDSEEIYEYFAVYNRGKLVAVRSGSWKLFIDEDGKPVLFNLEQDSGEQQNVAGDFPGVVEKLQKFFNKVNYELGSGKEKGPGVRPAGWVENPKPLVTPSREDK
jgi:arylsulfatase A